MRAVKGTTTQKTSLKQKTGCRTCIFSKNNSSGEAVATNQTHHDSTGPAVHLSRRAVLHGLVASPFLVCGGSHAEAVEPSCLETYSRFYTNPDYTSQGPFQVVNLPRLEHTCVDVFPACIGDRCLLRIDVSYPKGGFALNLGPPYPLAIITSGFLIGSDSYKSYADRLASWGYTVLRYDKVESVGDILDDVTSVAMLRDLISWCASDPLIRRIADPFNVFLVGHSRGGKISALAAAEDARVTALCLMDPVDNTVYAPLAPGYPSAVAALEGVRPSIRMLPVAVVGTEFGGDCAPKESNYDKFFQASPGPAWKVLIHEAGHFQFVDESSAILQRSMCPSGELSDEDVHDVSMAVMVSWGEVMVRRRGRDPRLSMPSDALCEAKSLPNSPTFSDLSNPTTVDIHSSQEAPMTWNLAPSLPNFFQNLLTQSRYLSGRSGMKVEALYTATDPKQLVLEEDSNAALTQAIDA